MRITQGTFSFLPPLSDEQIRRQIDYCLLRGFPVGVEHTDDPHPRNTYWEMWGPPLFDEAESDAIFREIDACRVAFPNRYVRVNAFDASRGRETMALSFIVQRPRDEAAFRLVRQERAGRGIGYTVARDQEPS